MVNFIQLNKFSELHDSENIIFCKTDFIYKEFENILRLNKPITLITGNSDYPITDEHVNAAPKNIIKWYAQNALSNNEIIEPIPIGLENKLSSMRDGHGIGYFERVSEKEMLLLRNINTEPDLFIYSNFDVRTNYERIKYRDISINLDYVDWEDNNLSLNDYFSKILKYKMILCPIGNGIDTHRLWEVLYSNRIPITVKVGNFKIYDLYEKLPIIILNNIEELAEKNLLIEKYNEALNKVWNVNLLDVNFWLKKISHGNC